MGSIEFRSGDLDRARSFLEEFVRIRKQNKEQPKDGHFVNVLFMIGNIHKIQGNHKVAKNSWSEEQDILQALGLARENPQIARWSAFWSQGGIT